MLARKISASIGTSAGRNGRSASFGCARAIILSPPRLKPAAHSSLHPPSCAAILLVLKLDTLRRELVADSVGLLEILRIASIDEFLDRGFVQTTGCLEGFRRFLFFPGEEARAIKAQKGQILSQLDGVRTLARSADPVSDHVKFCDRFRRVQIVTQGR